MMPLASIRPPALVRSQSSWSIASAHYKLWATLLGNSSVTPFFGGNFPALLLPHYCLPNFPQCVCCLIDSTFPFCSLFFFLAKGFPGVARVNKVTPVSSGSLSVFNKNSTLKGPPERARAGGADQWVLKRRKFPGLSSWIKFCIPGIPTTSFSISTLKPCP